MTATANKSATTRYIVGDYLFDPDLGLISGPSGAHYVCPRMTSLLLLLMEHAGEIVSCRQLIRSLWQDQTDHARALHQTISRLRHYFHDSPRAPAYIETVPGRGYRLVAVIYGSTPRPVISTADKETQPTRQKKGLAHLLREFRERKVCRSMLIYTIVIWLIWQVTDVVAPALDFPGWVESLIVYLGILGFPVAAVLSWIFDITPEGVRRDCRSDLVPVPVRSGRETVFDVVLITAAIAICVMLVTASWHQDPIALADLATPPSPELEVEKPASASPLVNHLHLD